MDLNKKNMKKIVFIISFSVILFLGLQNIGMVGNAIKWIFYLFVPLLMGFCIAFILNVLMKIMEGKWFSFLNHKNYKFWKIIKRPLCLLLTIGMVVGILFILLFLLIPELKKTFDIMVTNFPVYFSKIQSWIEDFIVSSSISEETLAFLQIDWNEVSKSIGESFKNISSKFLLSTVSFTTSIFGTVVNIVLALVFAVYMLLQKEKLSSQARKILYSYLPMDRADKLVSFGSLSYRTFSRFVSGQFLEAIIIGILCFLGMLVFSMPYASMISVLVGFTALIPMVGAFIGTAIGAFLIVMVDPMKALWFIIFIIVLQQIEGNLIYPKIVGNSVGLPGIWVILVLMLGGSLGGILGMLISVPLGSVFYCLLKESVKNNLVQKNIPKEKYRLK